MTHASQSAQQGVALLEAMIAILIFSMGILAIAGLQAVMIENSTGSKFRADASYIAQQKIGAIWADPVADHTELNTDISGLLPGGLRTTQQPVIGQFVITVGWTSPGETPATDAAAAPCFMLVAHCFTTVASVAGN